MPEEPHIHGLMKLLCFVCLGFLFAIPGEILNQLLSRQDPRGFRNTMISYFVLLVIGYFVGMALRAVIKRRALATLLFYLLFGCLGLTVEWFLLGNAPVADVFQLVTQPGMFSFWGTMLVGPSLLMEGSDFARLKRAFLIFYLSFCALYLGVALGVPRESGGIFFGFIIFAGGSASLNYFYVKYFRLLATRDAALPFGERS